MCPAQTSHLLSASKQRAEAYAYSVPNLLFYVIPNNYMYFVFPTSVTLHHFKVLKLKL